MKYAPFAVLVISLSACGDDPPAERDVDSGPLDAGPEPSKCAPVGGVLRVSQRGDVFDPLVDGDAAWPTIAAADDGVYVAWNTEPDDVVDPGGVERVYLARLDSAGARQGDPIEVGDGGRAPSVAASGGDVAIAWREVGIDGAGDPLRSVQVSVIGAGLALAAGTPIPNAEPLTSPSLVGATSGGGWGLALTVDPSDLAFIRLDGAATTATPEPKPVVVATIWARPVVVATPDGFAIGYTQDQGLHLQRVDDSGAAAGGPVDVAGGSFVPCRDDGGGRVCEQYSTSLAVTVSSDTIFLFNESGDVPASPDHRIYIHGVGLDGTSRLNSQTLLTARGPARNPAAVWTGDGVALVWSDGRDADSDLAGAFIAADGTPIGGGGSLGAARGDAETPAVAWLGSDAIVAYSSGESPARTILVQKFDCAP